MQKVRCQYHHSHKKRIESLEGSLNRVLFASKLEFSKILVPRLPQNTSNLNNECAGKLKRLYSLCEQLLVSQIYLYFIVLILMFLIDYTRCKLCNIWLLLFESNSRSITIQEFHTEGKTSLQLLLKTW